MAQYGVLTPACADSKYGSQPIAATKLRRAVKQRAARRLYQHPGGMAAVIASRKAVQHCVAAAVLVYLEDRAKRNGVDFSVSRTVQRSINPLDKSRLRVTSITISPLEII